MFVDLANVIAIATPVLTAFTTLLGLVYRELRQQISDKDGRIATLETEARETVKAKDVELAEWKRLALSQPTKAAS